MASILPPLPSPGVGARRKGPKSLPKLPLSAFSPPNTGSSEKFPLPPSPSTVHPEKVIDANVVASVSNIAEWNSQVGQVLGGRIGGVVISLRGEASDVVKETIATLEKIPPSIPILSILAPLDENADTLIASSSKTPINFVTTFSHPATPQQKPESIKRLLDKGLTVDLEVQNDLTRKTIAWEALGDFLEKAVGISERENRKGTLVLSNVLPPTHDFELPIVKLLTHPTYQAYQNHMSVVSLFANVYIKFLPPLWDAATPSAESDGKDKREWKRRIKMYLGPAVEAFGCQRIIFGSSPSPDFKSSSNASDWYEIAKESLAELGIEQSDINAVFHDNAREVYGSS